MNYSRSLGIVGPLVSSRVVPGVGETVKAQKDQVKELVFVAGRIHQARPLESIEEVPATITTNEVIA